MKKEETAPAKAAVTATMQQPAFVPEAPLDKYEFGFPTGAPGRAPASPLAKKLAKEKGLDLFHR